MNIIDATESEIRARMDRCAFEINAIMQNQASEGGVDKLLKHLNNYQRAAAQFEILQKVKDQISTSPPTEEEPDED
jgi:hypothetical protein|tara:strand:- start:4149 stop:4376 length:228 start_codon:yes stop_codon:yes gene_type:complete